MDEEMNIPLTDEEIARQEAERYVVRRPVWSGEPGERVLWGAVRWLYDHPSPWCPEGTDGYLGLAFD